MVALFSAVRSWKTNSLQFIIMLITSRSKTHHRINHGQECRASRLTVLHITIRGVASSPKWQLLALSKAACEPLPDSVLCMLTCMGNKLIVLPIACWLLWSNKSSMMEPVELEPCISYGYGAGQKQMPCYRMDFYNCIPPTVVFQDHTVYYKLQ